MDRRTTLALCLALATSLLVRAERSSAEPGACRRAVAKAAATHSQARIAALARCEDRVTAGKLPAGTDCELDPATAARLAVAANALRDTIADECGGADETCGAGGDDDALAAIGWEAGSCPDLLDQGCANPIAHCGDVADCVACLAEAGSSDLSELFFGALDLATPAGSKLERCQRSIGKSAVKFFKSKAKHLQKCWDDVLRGAHAGPCPDGTTATTIAKAEGRMIRSICRSCGGGDGCDEAVGSVPGSGGDDDFTASEIGFAAQCADVVVPGGVSCQSAIASLADLTSCVGCASDFASACLGAAAVPAATSYPASCGGEPAPPSCGETLFAETFTAANGASWPAAWSPIGSVDVADVQGNRGRFRPTPSGYSLARVFVSLAAPETAVDLEVSFTVEFEDLATQGVGFYARANGGYLDQSVPPGQGYAVFVEGFRGFHGIGVWREVNGVEQSILIDTSLALTDDVPYRVRFRVHQEDATTTRLQARLWPASDPEPLLWNVDATDITPQLQGIGGGIGADSWSEITWPGPIVAHTFLDDVQVDPICNPIAGAGSVETIAETFQFTEGPVWRADGTLAFTDIGADTIYRLTPPADVDVLRSPSAEANGLANDTGGDLLAAEHAGRRISRTDGVGIVTTVVGDYLGMAFNSPNDIAVRSDGTLYFTDPHYGLANPGDREIPFNGLFRRSPDGTLVAEWMGGTTSGPNGVALSPDETVLYMTNSATGEIVAWDVAVGGALSNPRPFADGLFIPDGLCVDTAGNLYVATWSSTVEVFDPSGAAWGSIAIPRQATNCAFGGADARSLYVTAHEGLYRVPMTIPGIP
jgi:gluconolactonase